MAGRRHAMRAAGQAILVFHLLAWVFMALNPWALPSGWLDLLLAPTFLLVFAFFIFLLPLDPVSLAARIGAFVLFVLAIRHRRAPWLWWILLAALASLGIAGLRVALAVARL